ncbi:D-alanyl-lipoteichoic acid acyltransferase DltB, MBOAT superfamily [Algoriphagus ornithinivorans]|uniref:D-alanyl-lipoteichoic acid acyltransferase DltB, MBOAT superfamily n=1 Tax=Algoriphagus ornithinivorans TaxID=226506 RepID=A0A1I5HJS9_9BACT|nr:MBOAT family O-acyltransferase [Algoriphagus ornithinivorans]SFO48196.1 D-alanyl-lipoteichoic acid acyltransferase DltB, MBOAT superfamily [Algoriphagus ornithinivorans]
MLFNSIDFLIFLPITFLLYWFVFQKKLWSQNLFILLSSYVFYAWWDWRFLALIIASSVVDYWCGLKLAVSTKKSAVASANRLLPTACVKHFQGKSLYLTLSLIFNLGLLGFFKYFNFFIDSTADMLLILGFQPNYGTLSIILPVGISFYTFQTLSYTIDIFKGKIKPTRNILAFFSYVAFFPQLVAGPIERAGSLLTQFLRKRQFSYENGSAGMQLILWGFFKKIVIADNCALVVNPIFENYQTASGVELIMGTVLFAIQIYGDFSGYSDIAIGVAKLFGFELMSNFKTPYFSRNIAEFWRRWHISLSTWFRDYLYFPLGGTKGTKLNAVRNIFIVFIISGLWHGANWTFVIWGVLHAALYALIFLFRKNRNLNKTSNHISIKEAPQILLTFILVCFAWIFFRAESLFEAWAYVVGMILNPFLPANFSWISYELRIILLLFLLAEWVGRAHTTWLERLEGKWYRFPAYFGTLGFILFAGVFSESQTFIYFQF